MAEALEGRGGDVRGAIPLVTASACWEGTDDTNKATGAVVVAVVVVVVVVVVDDDVVDPTTNAGDSIDNDDEAKGATDEAAGDDR